MKAKRSYILRYMKMLELLRLPPLLLLCIRIKAVLKFRESCESDGPPGHITSAVVQTCEPKVMCGPPLGPDSKEPMMVGMSRRGRRKKNINSGSFETDRVFAGSKKIY